MLIEVLLELLVGIVDVKLFEPIYLEGDNANTHTHTHTHIQVKCLNGSYRRVCCAQQIECVYAFTVQSSDLKILEAKDVQDTD